MAPPNSDWQRITFASRRDSHVISSQSQSMCPLGERNKYLLGPKLHDVATRQVRSPQNESNIQSALAKQRNLLARRAFKDVHFHLRVTCAIRPDDFAKETSCHRGQNSNIQMT